MLTPSMIDLRHCVVSNWDNLAVDDRISSQADDQIIHRPPEYADIWVDAQTPADSKDANWGL